MKLGLSAGNVTEEEVRSLIANPVYAGLGPFPQIVSDEQWVRAATKAIKEDGPEQFLVNLLHVLRESIPEGDDERALTSGRMLPSTWETFLAVCLLALGHHASKCTSSEL